MSKRAGLVVFHERPERVRFAFQAPFDGRRVIHPSTLNRRHGRGLFTANDRCQARGYNLILGDLVYEAMAESR